MRNLAYKCFCFTQIHGYDSRAHFSARGDAKQLISLNHRLVIVGDHEELGVFT